MPPSHINAPTKIPKMMRIKSISAKNDGRGTMASVLLITSVAFEPAIGFPALLIVSVASGVVI